MATPKNTYKLPLVALEAMGGRYARLLNQCRIPGPSWLIAPVREEAAALNAVLERGWCHHPPGWLHRPDHVKPESPWRACRLCHQPVLKEAP